MITALVIGGSNGIGLAIALELSSSHDQVVIVDKAVPVENLPQNVLFEQVNLLNNDISFLDKYVDVNTLIYTAGFGRVAPFETITEKEISNQFQVNAVSAIKVLHHFYPRMQKNDEFVCAVMGSISGLVSSPLFTLYSATKAALCKGVEALNIELEKSGTTNRILNVSPGSIKGTRFNGGNNDLRLTKSLAKEILSKAKKHETIFIPDYDMVFKDVIRRYQSDAHKFGLESYDYKMNTGRMNLIPQLKIGYLSGTFDLFHVGHLNLLRRAKQYCDYLVVGVHKDASHKGKETFIPFDERMAVVGSVRYVDLVIPSLPEDCDIYKNGIVKYDFLFVGSDYQGTERFNRYEEYFADKGVKIIYFPYTKGTSSTQIREAILEKSK